jgi:5-methylthioadenosine/S-adenosylhomocysteine deaminase
MTTIDTLLHARWLIPVEPDNTVYENYSIAINKGRIIALLPTTQAKETYQASNEQTFAHHVLLPSLINSHTHSAMTLLRGIADDLPLMEWLQNHIWVLEQKYMSEDFVRVGTDLAIAEMLLSGTTCFNDMYFYPEITAQQAIKHGIRANIGLIVFDFPTCWANNSDEYLIKGESLYQQLKNETLITCAIAPHAPYTVSDEPFKKVAQLSQKYNLRVHCHIHETANEINNAPVRPLQRLTDLGLVNELLLAVHATQLTEQEIKQLAQAKSSIIHCPESNLKLASGFCPIQDCVSAGINVALGTDGAASNNDLDMFGEMRTAALLAKAVSNNASAIPAMTALKMATINGAKALGLDNEIGSLLPNKSADIIAVDLNEWSTQPVYHPISQLVYAANRQQVTDVWIAGKQVVKQRQLMTFDLAELSNEIASWREKLGSAVE